MIEPLPASADLLACVIPLLKCSNERSGWSRSTRTLQTLFGADRTTALEFAEDNRATVRAWLGVDGPRFGTILPIAPDAQAAYVLDTPDVVVSPELESERRFVPSGILLGQGIRTSMTMSIEIAGRRRTVVGVHSSIPDRWDASDAAVFEQMGSLIGATMTRLRERDDLDLGARIDSLTGLMNRASILETLDEVVAASGPTSALVIDIDGFKAVNDTLGHRSGDRVLQTLASRIERSTGAGDRLGRTGGDEFLLLTDEEEPTDLAQRIIGHVEEVILVDSQVVQVSASVGIARRRSSDTAADLLERADRRMFSAKAAGRGQVRSDLRIDDTPAEAPRPQIRAHDALRLDQVDDAVTGLRVVVQPIVDAVTGELHGLEALARGPHGHPLEFPDRLFPTATTFGRLGVLELEAKRLAFDLPLPPDTMLYVNFEPVLLADRTWMDQLTEIWRTSGRRPSVTVELTEREVLTSPGRLLAAVDACREFGWKIALDDVGSRSDSLAALRWIDPDIVKLDMSLISGTNSAHTAHVNSAIASHRNTREPGAVRVIAEGVETSSHARSAGVLGADFLQGHLLGPPTEIADLDGAGSPDVDGLASSTPRHHGERLATKRQLIAMTRDIEASVLSADAILVATVQRTRTLSELTCRQYESLARRCAFVGMLGEGLTSADGVDLRGVRLAEIHPSDPLIDCWHVITLSPTASLALLATEVTVDPAAHDLDRLFTYRYVTDTTEVEDAARRLLRYF